MSTTWTVNGGKNWKIEDLLDHNFKYHSPKEGNAQNKLEETVMWANAAIARHGE